MKIAQFGVLINSAFNYVIKTSKMYNIDESHSLKHSMDVFHLTNKILNSEINNFPYLETQKDIIFASAILHDMCDKKYFVEEEGIKMINTFISDYMPKDKIDIMNKIILTMSYSKVKKNGYPELGNYQMAYHIVREADLLAAYDVERSVIYALMVEKMNYVDAITRTVHLFDDRILQYRPDNLFVTDYSKKASLYLHLKSIIDINNIKTII